MTDPHYIVTVELDENGDQVIELPPELLATLNWNENTNLIWGVDGEEITLRQEYPVDELLAEELDDPRTINYASLGLIAAATVAAAVLVGWVLQGAF